MALDERVAVPPGYGLCFEPVRILVGFPFVRVESGIDTGFPLLEREAITDSRINAAGQIYLLYWLAVPSDPERSLVRFALPPH